MKTVIISKDQPEFIEELVSKLDTDYVIVLDRCTKAYPSGYNYIENKSGIGFLAGFCRDLGAKDVNDDILFLDGDKIPDVQEKKVSSLSTMGYDCVLLGLGRKDLRLFMRSGEGLVPYSSQSSIRSEIYSCGIYLSRNIIEKVRVLNDGRIFNSLFDGRWGEEDRYLGDELTYLGAKIGYTSHIVLANNITNLASSDDISKRKDYIKNHEIRLYLRSKLVKQENIKTEELKENVRTKPAFSIDRNENPLFFV